MGSFSEGFSKIPQTCTTESTKDTGLQGHFQQAPTWSPDKDSTSAIQEKLHQAKQYLEYGFQQMADVIVQQSGQVQKRYNIIYLF